MTTQTTPTHIGFFKQSGLWAFSPSNIVNADLVWDISHWTFDMIKDLMAMDSDLHRVAHLIQELGLPNEMKRDYLAEMRGN